MATQPATIRPTSANIDAALARNGTFAAAGAHEGVAVLPSLRLLLIMCVDPRVDPAHVLGLNLGDAIVVRNGGGRVTAEVIETVAFIGQIVEDIAPDGGGMFEVAVIHHTQCGTGLLADDDFRHRYAQRIGSDESELLELAVVDPFATVVIDVDRLRTASEISSRLTVSGHVYDVTTGLVQTVTPADEEAATSTRRG